MAGWLRGGQEETWITNLILIFFLLKLPSTVRPYAVSGQNKIGRELTPLALIQPTDNRQNAVNNNWLLKLQPAVMQQN